MQIYRRGSRELFELPDDLLGEERIAENNELSEAARQWLASELTRETEVAAELWREAVPALSLDSQLLALCARVRKKHYSYLVAEFIQCDGLDALARLTQQCPLPLLAELQRHARLPEQKALATLVRSHIKTNAVPVPVTRADELGLGRIEPVSNLEFVGRVIVSTEYVFPMGSFGNLHERAWGVLFELCSGLYAHFAQGRHASLVPGMLQTVTVSGFRANRSSKSPLRRKAAAARDGGVSLEPPPPAQDIREALQLLSSAQGSAPIAPLAAATPAAAATTEEADSASAANPAPPIESRDEGQGIRAALSALWGRVRGRQTEPPAVEDPAEAAQQLTKSNQ